MVQIKQFNGGLNTRLNKHLISTNESTICNGVDLFSNALSSIKDDLNTGIAVDNYIYNYEDTWLSYSTLDINIVDFQGNLYASDGIQQPLKGYDVLNNVWHRLGINKPTTFTASVGSAGVLDSTYTYCYTYYDSSDGSESMPSPYKEIVLTNQQATLTVHGSGLAQVDKIRIYRVGGNLSDFTLVAEISNPYNSSQTYTDNTPDIDIVSNRILDSQNHGVPPEDMLYLTEANAMFFGAVGDILWFSEVGNVNAWSPYNFISFDDTITGLRNTANGLFVFTKYKTYIVPGNSPETLSKFLLDDTQGCLNHRTIKNVRGNIVWLSSDGVCASTGGEVVVVTKNKLGKITYPSSNAAETLNDVYYLSTSTETLVLDFRESTIPIISKLDITPTNWHVYNDELYYSYNGYLYKYAASTSDRTLQYKTGFITLDHSYFTFHDTMRISYEGSFLLRISTKDNDYEFTLNSNTRKIEELIGFNGVVSDGIEFYFNGVGTIYEISYDTYNRTEIMQSPRFYSAGAINFKQSVLVNNNPMIFNLLANDVYESDIIPLSITNLKIFNFLYFTYIGTVNVKVFIDMEEVASYALTSETLSTSEHKLPSSSKRAYSIYFQYTLGNNSKLYNIEIPVEGRQNAR